MSIDEYNKFMGNIVNTMNDGLFLVRTDGTIAMVNNALLQITGFSREDLLGKPCTVLDCDVCRKARSKGGVHWCRMFKEEPDHRKHCLMRRKDGAYVHVLKNASVLTDGDEVIGAVETVTDLTELGRKDETIQELKRLLDAEDSFHGLVGRSEAMRRVYSLIERAAQSDAPVIIYGESGTGKELAAHAIHELGKRANGPFIQCNCAALTVSLLESELFGHVKGAFTGAYRHQVGRFEAADGGDLFLDEIGDAPMEIQVKLLRVLETKRFERVGDHRPIHVDVRIITATNRDLPIQVRSNEFREDLYFRINVIPITMPPLRERREDIPLLAEHFIRRKQHSGASIRGLSPEAMRLCMTYSWPGNVRELVSAMEYAAVVSDSELVQPGHLPPAIANGHGECRSSAHDGNSSAAGSSVEKIPEQKAQLLQALEQTHGNKSKTARLLGVSRMTVLNRMRKYGLNTQTVITAGS
jgi:PAS domain S-box-containing protein